MNFLRKYVLNGPMYCVVVGVCFGIALTCFSLVGLHLIDPSPVFSIGGDIIFRAGLAALVLGIIGVVYWNLTD